MSASKDKGTAWESAVVEFLVEVGGWPNVERRALRGTNDQGDISGLPGVVIEAKNEKSMRLGSYLDEAEAERINAKADVGVVWHHRRGRASAAQGFVTMTPETFVGLLRLAGW